MRLSIITVNLNNKTGLENTIKSVFQQTNRDFEFIVIDGLSKDGSRDVITANANRITKWVSEKDSGIFNAMNKGIGLAQGEYLLFLNSGDYLYSTDTLEKVSKHQFSEDFVVFDIELVRREGREVRRLEKDPREILIIGEIFHQAVFHHRRVFQKLGLYDEAFPLVADYELFLRAFFKAGCTCKSIHEVLVEYDHIYGMSSDIKNAQRYHDERRKAQRNVFDAEVVDAFERQHKEIESLSRFKSLYEGLMQSHTVQLALQASAALRRVRKLLGRKTPV